MQHMFPQKHFVILWIRKPTFYVMLIVVSPYSCADPESRARGGSILACIFFSCLCVCVGGGGGVVVTRTLVRKERSSKYHYKRAIIDPPAKRHLNGVSPMMAPY